MSRFAGLGYFDGPKKRQKPAPASIPDFRNTLPNAPEAIPKTRNTLPDAPEATPKTRNAFPDNPEASPKTRNAFPDNPKASPKTRNAFPDNPEAIPKTRNAFPNTPKAFPKTRNAFPGVPQRFRDCPPPAPMLRWAYANLQSVYLYVRRLYARRVNRSTMKPAFALIVLTLVAAVHAAAPPTPESLMSRVQKLVNDLASTGGFSDEDAVTASVFFLDQLVGPQPADKKPSTRVEVSTPGRVRVFAGYDFGIGFRTFEFEYLRGDPNQGMRWAQFRKLEFIGPE